MVTPQLATSSGSHAERSWRKIDSYENFQGQALPSGALIYENVECLLFSVDAYRTVYHACTGRQSRQDVLILCIYTEATSLPSDSHKG